MKMLSAAEFWAVLSLALKNSVFNEPVIVKITTAGTRIGLNKMCLWTIPKQELQVSPNHLLEIVRILMSKSGDYVYHAFCAIIS